jgi:hypothetical protein
MDRFAVGTDVELFMAFVDANGNPVTPNSATYNLYDETEALLTGPVAVSDVSGEAADIIITRNFNTPAGARRVELAITTSSGVTYVDAIYEVFDQQNRLIPLTNSFQTYLQAQLVANKLTGLIGFIGASEDQQIAALSTAYDRLTQFAYLIKWPEYVDTQNIYLQDMHARITPQMWPVMTPVLFAPYPIQFQQALMKAQVVEANAILTPDPIGDRRRTGLLAESIGESKMMFRGGIRPLSMGISNDTLRVVRAYLDYRFTLTRAV